MDKEFKKQFKLSFIKSLKLGFDIKEIKNSLKKRSYPSDLINRLIEDLKYDRDITKFLQKPTKIPEEPKKPSFLEKIKNKLSKLSESEKINRVTKIHSIYYNLIINKKRKLTEEYSYIDDILNNPENKKLISSFIRAKQGHIKEIQKLIRKIRKISKTLMGQGIQQDYKDKVNNILEFLDKEETQLKKEIKILQEIKQLTNLPDDLKRLLQKERFQIRRKENSLNIKINEISKKSPKFREAISQV